MSNIEIFEYTNPDSDTISEATYNFLKIQEICGLSEWTSNNYKEEFGRIDSKLFSVTNVKTIIGCAALRLINPDLINSNYQLVFEEAEILIFALDPNFQNKGIGSALLQKVLLTSRNSGVKTVWLEVRESNYKAINFYKKNYFQHVYSRANYYQNPLENALVMKKDLGKNEKCFV